MILEKIRVFLFDLLGKVLYNLSHSSVLAQSIEVVYTYIYTISIIFSDSIPKVQVALGVAVASFFC